MGTPRWNVECSGIDHTSASSCRLKLSPLLTYRSPTFVCLSPFCFRSFPPPVHSAHFSRHVPLLFSSVMSFPYISTSPISPPLFSVFFFATREGLTSFFLEPPFPSGPRAGFFLDLLRFFPFCFTRCPLIFPYCRFFRPPFPRPPARTCFFFSSVDFV